MTLAKHHSNHRDSCRQRALGLKLLAKAHKTLFQRQGLGALPTSTRVPFQWVQLQGTVNYSRYVQRSPQGQSRFPWLIGQAPAQTCRTSLMSLSPFKHDVRMSPALSRCACSSFARVCGRLQVWASVIRLILIA